MFLQKYKHFYGCIDYYFFHSYIVQFLFLFFCFKMLIAEVVFLLHLVSTHVARIQTTAIFWRESTETLDVAELAPGQLFDFKKGKFRLFAQL